jgi:hypothetical protein
MFYSIYNNTIVNFSRLWEKTITQFLFVNKQQTLFAFNIRTLEITLRIPSKLVYEHGFIAMLMLTEKLLNNKIIFLLDKNTLSKKRTIKIGAVITLKNENMNNFLVFCCNHSIPKFFDDGIFFHIPYENHALSYKIKKILSNTLFSFDRDINSYYDYLGELEYDIDFLFRTYFKSTLINKLILSNNGIHFINCINTISLIEMQEAEERSLLEEFEFEFILEQNELNSKLENNIIDSDYSTDDNESIDNIVDEIVDSDVTNKNNLIDNYTNNEFEQNKKRLKFDTNSFSYLYSDDSNGRK